MGRTLSLCAVLCFASTAFAQEDYVSRYEVYTGFNYAADSNLNLAQRGFHTQGGVTLTRLTSLGLDFSVLSGHSSVGPWQLNKNVQNQMAALAASQGIPPSAKAGFTVPLSATTYTFAGGPQMVFRKMRRVSAMYAKVRSASANRPM